jgi:formylglycine-generating enzyme required for sulfatase activity
MKERLAWTLTAFAVASLGMMPVARAAEEQPKAKMPKELTLDCGSGVTMKLVLIPAGEFMMGSPANEAERGGDEGPQHRVKITRPFYMGVYLVTQAKYKAVMGVNPSQFKGEINPVEEVTWNDAVEFCRKLSEKTGQTVRLPTEAEWEYACRAGTTTPFNTGETISTDQANYWGNYTYGSGSKGVWRRKTVPVGSFAPNAWGLYDMHGNVEEWCQDWYGPYQAGEAVDPLGAATGEYRVTRGGCWDYNPGACRSASRFWGPPGYQGYDIGFRVACAPRP